MDKSLQIRKSHYKVMWLVKSYFLDDISSKWNFYGICAQNAWENVCVRIRCKQVAAEDSTFHYRLQDDQEENQTKTINTDMYSDLRPVKRRVMREKRNLQDNERFYDDISKRNLELMKRLNETEWFSDVWYVNCGVYGRTSDGLQLKFNIFDDIFLRLRQWK
ncbi:unnamed protein product [Mytilus coruscus]|uniref:Uncharacterized protein n=1 Tax=Mytilus coruscus TaxID=42192 RepID=A0A6J8E5D9_MYTCO|nr:unnamed protein product [Mytilus coruscus]